MAERKTPDAPSAQMPSPSVAAHASGGIGDEKNREFARGISSYDSSDIEKIKGFHSDKIDEILGYKFDDDVIIKDNLVLV